MPLVVPLMLMLAVLQATDSSKAQVAVGEVNALIRQVLADRISAKDIPDFGLLRDAKRIAVQSDVGLALPLGKEALPVLEGYELRLISTGEAAAEAERTGANLHFIAIQHLKIAEDTASLWIGVDFAMATHPQWVKTCCCIRSVEYRLAQGRWVFVRWGNEGYCR